MLSETAGRWGTKFQVYAGIEVFIWMPALYATCYTLQPTARLMQTHVGKRSVERMASCLQRYTPSYHDTLVRLSSKIYGAPKTRAFAEWALLMKLLAPVAFPIKMYIAHVVVERTDWHDKGGETLVADSVAWESNQPGPAPPPAPPPPPQGEDSPPPATALRRAHAHLAHAGHAPSRQRADTAGRRGDDHRRGDVHGRGPEQWRQHWLKRH